MESLYVCLFSNGHIKVGRSVDPKSRIASHADRVACMGVELSDYWTQWCVGAAAPCEAALIERCATAAERRFQSEWFAGLDYLTVCGWAAECAAQEHERSDLTELRAFLDRLPLGGVRAFADAIGINPVYLSQLATRLAGRQPSEKLAVVIERESKCQVRRWDLRPTDWHLIWPELIVMDGAPPPPQPQEEKQAA